MISATGRPATPLDTSASTLSLPRTRTPPRSGSTPSTVTVPQPISAARASSAAGRETVSLRSVSTPASAASRTERTVSDSVSSAGEPSMPVTISAGVSFHTCNFSPTLTRKTMWPFSYLASTCSTSPATRQGMSLAAPGSSKAWLSCACAVRERSEASSPCR